MIEDQSYTSDMKGSETSSVEVLMEFERGVHAALEMYSNIHRGSGQYSMVSTALFEQARDIVLEHLGLDSDGYVTIFCTPQRVEHLKAQLKPASYHTVSSQDIGLPLGIRALVVERKGLPKGIPFQTGGGVVKLVNPNSVVWADAPDRFEAGTPNIINVIAFAKSLQLTEHFGDNVFKEQVHQTATATAAEILYHDQFLEYSGKELLFELRKAMIGRDVHVPTVEGETPYTNLDNAASTPTFSPIWEVVCSKFTLRDLMNKGNWCICIYDRKELNKLVLLITSGDGDWKPKDSPVDSISSASQIAEVDSLVADILKQLDGILGKST
jgi:hypothetical protein